jgi:hypothetical protein
MAVYEYVLLQSMSRKAHKEPLARSTTMMHSFLSYKYMFTAITNKIRWPPWVYAMKALSAITPATVKQPGYF